MKQLILGAFFLLMISGCKKYDDSVAASHLQVPPFTETGANTFGCFINGQPWANFGYFVKKGELGVTGIDSVNIRSYLNFFNPPDSALTINPDLYVYKKSLLIRDEYIFLNIPKNGNLKGIHKLTSQDYLFGLEDLTHLSNYASLIRNPFTVTIYKDTLAGTKHIVSGMFNGVLYNARQTDSLVVTGGVFDVVVQ